MTMNNETHYLTDKDRRLLSAINVDNINPETIKRTKARAYVQLNKLDDDIKDDIFYSTTASVYGNTPTENDTYYISFIKDNDGQITLDDMAVVHNKKQYNTSSYLDVAVWLFKYEDEAGYKKFMSDLKAITDIVNDRFRKIKTA